MRVNFSNKAERVFYKLDKSIQTQIQTFIAKLKELKDPRSCGKRLTGNLQGLWRYRVGKYRLVCKILDRELVILALDIGHRKEVYDK